MMARKDEIIWGNIARLLDERGMTKAELARLAKTRPQTLQAIQDRVRGIGASLIGRVAKALEVDVAVLMKEPDASPQLPVHTPTDQLLLLLVEQQSKRIDALERQIADLRDERKVIVDGYNRDHDEHRGRINKIHDALLNLHNTKDLESIGKAARDGIVGRVPPVLAYSCAKGADIVFLHKYQKGQGTE